MNQIKQSNGSEMTITISDLRYLGRQGGVTARLDDGREMKLLPRFGTVSEKGYIAGELQAVDVVVDYPKIYSHIRTIMHNGVLVARREKQGNKTVLKTTGKGYKKPKN
ncbi:hypothetical protein ACVR1I_03000 [Streptococcus cameli]